ncbi:MAG: efflux RND transporter periplasmic adaptor subunit [Patescibacteria group bacterium]|nr:efflux RND transporter periplasmic adaptor subunit [Patescibacteria group bacterium]
MKKILGLIWRHKIYSLIVLVILGTGGYFGYQKWFVSEESVRYITAKAERGVLTTSISGTGQISASSQVDIKTKTSGDVTYVGAKTGQEVKSGTLLVSLNTKEALKTVRDAEESLETAKLSLEKLLQPADELTLLQAEHSLEQAKESKQKAVESLKKAYDDGFNGVANAFLDIPSVMTGMQDLLYSNNYTNTQMNFEYYAEQVRSRLFDEKALEYKNDANVKYQAAREAYNKNFQDYKSASRFSDNETIEALIVETYDSVKTIAEAVKSANNLVQYYIDKFTEANLKTQTLATTHLSSLSSYTGKTNSHLLSLLSTKQTFQTNKETIINADRTIAEKTGSLADLKAGADPLDVRSQNLSIKQKEYALADAKEKLADYYVYAPFDGTIVAFDVKKGDSVSASAVLGTIITKQRIATISLNEIDVAKVKVGQNVILTFDAVDDLSITGQVAEVDALGTTSQGVVSYNVEIVFDIQDERIKPGMSVSASIILESKQDVLMVSSSAVKTQGTNSYVEQLDSAGALVRKTVQIGASNDTMTEITEGLTDGEEIIAQKISTGAASTSKTTTNNSSSGPGVGGDMMRMMR